MSSTKVPTHYHPCQSILPSPPNPFLAFLPSWRPLLRLFPNQACLTSAAATIPRHAQLAHRGSHHRGPARAPPTLAHNPARARIDDCLIEPDRQKIWIQVRVYPPAISPNFVSLSSCTADGAHPAPRMYSRAGSVPSHQQCLCRHPRRGRSPL
ncbi:hypothetical protein L208DRAFT_626082 [Tricholoma matsutake]|nr:hypothetical protein L208DRAFT_626082 [Tricholoma matsutake 945]